MAYGTLVERTIPLSRAEFFARLADFGGIGRFMGADVEKVESRGEGIGMIRAVTVRGVPGALEERLEALVDGRLLSYSIVNETSLPLERYHAVVELEDAPGGGTHVRWGSNWIAKGAPDETVDEMLTGLYGRLIEGLAKGG
jgi:Polyketide cyclase / dehydrase and lipid transport